MTQRFSITVLAALVLAAAHVFTASAIIIDDFNENADGVYSHAFIGGYKSGPGPEEDTYFFFPDGNLGSIEVMGDVRHSYGFIADYGEGSQSDSSDSMEMVMMTRTTNHLGELRGVWEAQDLYRENPRSPITNAFTSIWWDAGPNAEDKWQGPGTVPFDGYNTEWTYPIGSGGDTNTIIDWAHAESASKSRDIAFNLMEGPGSTFYGFEIDAWRSNGNVSATLSVEVHSMTGATDFVTIPWPTSATYVTYQIPFSSFGGIGADEWTNIGSVRLTLDFAGAAFQGRVDEIRTVIPEPGTMSLVLLGGGLVMGLRRRKKA